MKYSILSISIIYICILCGCTNNETNDSTNDKKSIVESKISAEEAIKMSSDLANQMRSVTRTNDCIEVKDVLHWRKKDIIKACNLNMKEKMQSVLPDTMLYVVNFKDSKGYAIVAADTRLGGVIAIIEKGNYSPSDVIENDGLRFYMKMLCYYFEKYIAAKEVPITRSMNAYTEWVVTEQVGPLTWTEWHQSDPYNRNCPTINGQKAPAGCVPIAIGQIMAYHHAPTSYNNNYYLWDDFGNPLETPTTTAGCNSVASLIATLGSQTNVTYGLDGSGTSFLNSLNGFEYMGYHYEYVNPYSLDLCWNEIDHSRPFFFSGHDEESGHAWVVDGYMVKERVNISNPNDVQYQDYIHCNWGWGGSSNGFYRDIFITQYFYPIDIRIIYNIYPVNYNPS